METKIGTRMRKRSPRTDKPECQNRKQIDTHIRPHLKSCFWKSALLDPNFFGKASYSRDPFAKLPNRIPPTAESKNGQLSNQNLIEILDIQIKN